MHCINDKPNGIIVNHNADWSGEVRIAWYIVGEPSSLRECWCNGPDLIAGRFTPVSVADRILNSSKLPIDVLTRAVALAVEKLLRSKIECAMDVDVFIKRGKL